MSNELIGVVVLVVCCFSLLSGGFFIPLRFHLLFFTYFSFFLFYFAERRVGEMLVEQSLLFCRF